MLGTAVQNLVSRAIWPSRFGRHLALNNIAVRE